MRNSTLVEQIKTDVALLDADDFSDVMYWIITTEKRRRESETAREDARVAMVMEMRETSPEMAPPADKDGVMQWVAPLTPFHAYLPGEIVSHDGIRWSSVSSRLNSEVPGESPLWARVVDVPEAPDVPEVAPDPVADAETPQDPADGPETPEATTDPAETVEAPDVPPDAPDAPPEESEPATEP